MRMSAKVTTGSVLLTHDVGLHARPSVKLTKLAKTFVSRIELAVASSGPWIDAKSIVKVMAAKAPQGSTLFLRAEGEDAQDAIDALVSLVTRDFDEGGAHAQSA
jgi:phosphocarrier protein HPr